MSKKNNKMQKPKIFEARIATLGDTTVGKTSLTVKYVDETFDLNTLHTIGVDSKIKYITLENGENIKVILIDTAGQEIYRSLAANYLKKADGILLVYDITEQQTFEGVKRWAESIKEQTEDDKPIILIGNKTDLNDKRAVNKEDGEKFAKTLGDGVKFYETSCKTGENVEDAINDLVYQIYVNNSGINTNRENNIKLDAKKQGKSKNKCC